MKSPAALAVTVALSLSTPLQAADCAREDIDHYLDRGFTPQQVLELCRGSQTADSPAQMEQRGDVAERLRLLIDADELHLSERELSFSRALCIEYDRPDFAQQRKKACGRGDFVIAREGLEVLDSRKKLLFWGRSEVQVQSSQIEQDYQLGQAELPPRHQRELARALPQGNQLAIPLREGAALSELEKLLGEIAR